MGIFVSVLFSNLVTAVIINTVFENSEKDNDLKMRLRTDHNKNQINQLRAIFLRIDTDGSGTLSKAEYLYAVLYNEAIKKKLKVLEVDDREAIEMWELLDLGT